MRSEEHTSELQSRGLISYAVFCLKKKKVASLSSVSRPAQKTTCTADRRMCGGVPAGTNHRVHSVSLDFEPAHAFAPSFFLMIRRPPRSTLFPSTTPFQ